MRKVYKPSFGDCSLGALLLCAIYHGKPQPQAEMSPALQNAHSERVCGGGGWRWGDWS